MAWGASLNGTAQFTTRLRRFPLAYKEQVVAPAMDAEQRIELDEMKRRTPVDTGDLRDSGEIIPAVVTARLVTGGFFFDMPYAAIVHEDLEAFHRVGQAKYAESVIRESQPYYGERLAKRCDVSKVIL